MRPKLWEHAACSGEAVDRLARELRLPPVIARLLVLRGLSDPDAARRFLDPRLEDLHDPARLTGLPQAVERIEAAIARREKIAIHGDYDVDGITSTVILRRAIELLGGECVHFIPERLRDGYGLQVPAIERLHADNVRLIVSVDCGIRSADAARRSKDLGVDLIITDHHEPEDELPPALVVINPKRADCTYPDKNLAGVGVALKLVQALMARHGRQKMLPGFVKIAALGTLADVVPLVGENRIIARIGLERLSAGPHTVGVQALLEAAGLLGRTVDSWHVAFQLAPRVNAAGRMSTPDIATRLLLANDQRFADDARRLAGQLNEENQRRQDEEATIVAAARAVIDADPAVGAHNVLVVAGEGWHRGVIGIVASKLVDAYNKPAIVLSLDGDTAHGSCRSIAAFDMLGALTRCADLFDRYGGHKLAAGLTLGRHRVDELRARMASWGLEVLSPDDLRPRLSVDAALDLDGITPEVVQGLDRLAPFGAGNPRPVFHAAGAEIVQGPFRLKDRHVSLTVRQGNRQFRAIGWRAAERFDEIDTGRRSLDLAYSIDRNTFRGETTLELTLADVRAVPVPVRAPAPATEAGPA